VLRKEAAVRQRLVAANHLAHGSATLPPVGVCAGPFERGSENALAPQGRVSTESPT